MNDKEKLTCEEQEKQERYNAMSFLQSRRMNLLMKSESDSEFMYLSEYTVNKSFGIVKDFYDSIELSKLNKRNLDRKMELSEIMAITALLLSVEMFKQPTFKENKKTYGDKFTIEEFKQTVKEGGFIDYDGSGRYAIGDNESDISVNCNVKFINLAQKIHGFTHVFWYNK